MKKLLVAVALVCAFMAGCGAVEAGAEQGENRARFELVDTEYFDSDSYAKIVVDTETGVMYFVLDIYRGGGVTVMVDSTGKPLIWEGEE